MILDTNALSALADGDPGLEPVLQGTRGVELPVIVLGEYRYGVRRSRNRARYERWLADLIGHSRVLEADMDTSGHYAEVRDSLKQQGKPIPANDVWIAALARQHRVPVLSRDHHFDFVSGVRRISW